MENSWNSMMAMKRIVVPELIDSDDGNPEEIGGALADLRMINQRFGGLHSMTALLSSVALRLEAANLSWLDVAGASGDVAEFARKDLGRRGIRLQPVLLDRSLAHL